MKLKTLTLEGKTYALVQDDKPVYTKDDGSEIAFDAVATVGTITRLNGEAKTHREAKEAAEAKLKGFEGIEDPEKARKALETVSNLDAGQLVTAGKVQEIKDEAKKAAETQVTAATGALKTQLETSNKERDTFRDQLFGEKVGNAFARSKFITDKVAVPADLVQSQFGTNFKVEEGKIVAYDKSGNKIYSPARPGEIADFDEALELMINAYPHKDSILKGKGQSGGGSRQGEGGGKGEKTISRADFEALPLNDRTAKMRDGFKVAD